MRRRGMQVLFHFGLGAQAYAKARVKPTTKASLWLGAGVMLEYPVDEAVQLLVRLSPPAPPPPPPPRSSLMPPPPIAQTPRCAFFWWLEPISKSECWN